MGNTALVLWLEGGDPELLGGVSAVRSLAGRGVDARLSPLPLVETGTCYYQTLSGMGSGKTGRFDSVRPVGYAIREDAGVPEGIWQRLLPDLVRGEGRTATFLELDASEVGRAVGAASSDCVILRVHGASSAGIEAIEALVRLCEDAVGQEGHLVVLTDVAHSQPSTLVNMNDFLAEIGVLETRDTIPAGKEIVWPESLAYALGTGQIWVNMRGREPEGVVAPGREYDDVCDVLIAALRDDWRDPATDEPVVECVLRKGDAYTGEYLFKAPDLIVVYRPGYGPSPRARAIALDGASVRPGASDTHPHAPYARLVAGGPAFARRGRMEGRLIDVVPSLMYLLGLPIPAHVDGQVLTDWFSPEYRERTPIIRATDGAIPLSREDEGVIVDRLQALGYLG